MCCSGQLINICEKIFRLHYLYTDCSEDMSLERKLSCKTKTLLESQPPDTACKHNEEVDIVPLSTSLRNTIVLSDCVAKYRQADFEIVSQLVENAAEMETTKENNKNIGQHQTSILNDCKIFGKIDLTQ